MEDEEDDTACEAAIADDWASDTCGEPLLSRERFFDALLELADAWTAEASEQAYNEFLWRLFENVTTLRRTCPARPSTLRRKKSRPLTARRCGGR